jgi:sortase (surface protein transpeptidase)
MTKERLSIPKQSIAAVALLALGLVLASIAIVLRVQSEHTEPKPSPGVQASPSAPSSVKPKAQAVATYTVPPDNPKDISIPAINTGTVRVFKLGLLTDGSIGVPNNIYDAGWYNASAKPGQNGAMFIYGHVSNWEANGAFHDLKKLKPGDTVTVTRGDDQKFTYKVVISETYSARSVPMDKVLAPITPGQQGFNLMTCAGKVIKGTSEFTDRLVVYASLVKG